MAEWIWLNAEEYPSCQTTRCTIFGDGTCGCFAVTEFERAVALREKPARVKLRVCGDTKYWLWADGAFLGMGPVCAGGDYGNTLPMPCCYASRYELTDAGCSLRLFARVQLSPAVMTDYSQGRGGFYLEGEAEYADGSRETFGTDGSWQARYNGQYLSADTVDFTVAPDEWRRAQTVGSVWTMKDSPLPLLHEERIEPVSPVSLTAGPGETAETVVLFDKIYSGYVTFSVGTEDRCTVTAVPFELEGQEARPETVTCDSETAYRSLLMQSVGGYKLRLVNEGSRTARVTDAALIFTCYPGEPTGAFRCSDEGLNRVYDVCRHTLRICRQSEHLDSPRHQETLGCTGDYYIESLMNYYTFGDARLTRLDIVRTADWLTMADGFMFHTTYSLIWVEMLHDYLMYTGDYDILGEVMPALDRLLARFADYVGENGLIETPPSWMFVDWVVVDGHSLHHPPKALGQTALCALYYRTLNRAADIYGGDFETQAETCRRRAKCLNEAFNALLWDEAEGLYVDGLNTPQRPCGRPLPPGLPDVSGFMPENADKRYHTKQANTLAVLCGLCGDERARNIMRRVMEDDSLPDFQPYFAHYVLDALEKTKQFEDYGMALLNRWKPMVEACGKGLQEGWIAPGPGYSFDHSHAWGGTPAYQLPCRLLGLEIIEPGMRRIALHPQPSGLEWADVTVPTPRGPLRCSLRGGKISVDKPDGMIVEIK